MRKNDTEQSALNPVALCLAMWLGCIAMVTGFARLSQHAAVQAAIAQNTAHLDKSTPPPKPLDPWLIANGA